ncbi:MAG: cytochrome c biogenesis protein CcsA [Ignavibacteriae bacterium]|nr:cytochrome C biogenesis protein [Ignavibacteriota bacterium]NOG99743.1 cytochrome c biogenesis protein CcsA [Ignavibacteriota bacterium]
MLGNILITISLGASLFSIYFYYKSFKGFNKIQYARLSYHVMTITIILASVFLMYAIVTHQYQYQYVFNYSNADLSTGLLLSTFFAGQEGSFLLWLLFTSLIGIALISATQKNHQLESSVMVIYTFAISFLLMMVSPILKSPFELLWSESSYLSVKYFNDSYLGMAAIKNFIVSNSNSGETFVHVNKDLISTLNLNGIAFENFLIKGKGLNPLLQNFWMQIHPPILFLGYALVTVPYAFAVSASLRNDFKDWINEALPWVIGSLLILGLGIMIGGYWAYGVLGWGGYWAWDPVENASLIPWIILAALLHTMLIQKKSQTAINSAKFVKTNLVLAALSYIFVIYSTFLTRSGILSDASVHSFADPGQTVYTFLLIYILTFTALGIGIVYLKRKNIKLPLKKTDNILSREYGLFYGAFALIASAIVVFVGTSAPIFGQSVDVDFYNKMNLPLVIFMGVLIGLTLYLNWGFSNSKKIVKSILPTFIASIIASTIVLVLLGKIDVILMIFTFSIFFTITTNFYFLYLTSMTNVIFSGGKISHIGFAIFLLGVMITGYFSESGQVELVKNEKQKVLNREITFTGIKPIEGGKKYQFNIAVDEDYSNFVAEPVMYISSFNNSLMREPSIISSFNKDLYFSPTSYEEGKGTNNNNSVVLKKGETKEYNGLKINFVGFQFPDAIMEKMQSGEDFEIGVNLKLYKDEKEYSSTPVMKFENGNKSYSNVVLDEIGVKIILESLDVAGNVQLTIGNINDAVASPVKKESLTIEFSVKPFMSLVWIGVILMAIGFTISTLRRRREVMV